MEAYSISKARENLKNSSDNVSEFKVKVVNAATTKINSLIEEATISGITNVQFAFANLQDLLLKDSVDRKEQKTTYTLLNQFGDELMLTLTNKYLNAGYTADLSNGLLKIVVK